MCHISPPLLGRVGRQRLPPVRFTSGLEPMPLRISQRLWLWHLVNMPAAAAVLWQRRWYARLWRLTFTKSHLNRPPISQPRGTEERFICSFQLSPSCYANQSATAQRKLEL